jgi:type II secretory pathway pseudopilin PulG
LSNFENRRNPGFQITQLPNYTITQSSPMVFHSQTRPRASRKAGASSNSERGYILLTLLLIVALMIIATGVILPSLTFEIRRDREEEMIHRGVQYSRAIRAYYKKFGRYPTKLEDLESTSNLRFLRKRYKDPLTGKDFKLLHFGEVQLSLSGMGGGIAGASPIGSPGTSGAAGGPGGPGQSAFGQTSTFGGNSNAGSTFSLSGSAGANGNSPTGQNGQAGDTSSGTGATQPGAQTPSDGTGTNPSGTSGDSDQPSPGQIGSGQIIGGTIIGVASTSKDTTIREFNHKTKYKDWMFVYDPAQDLGRLITTPYQPQLAGFGQQGTPNLNGTSPNSSSGFGNGTGSGFGNSSSSFQNSPSGTGSFGSSGQPSNPPPQQNPPQQQ